MREFKFLLYQKYRCKGMRDIDFDFNFVFESFTHRITYTRLGNETKKNSLRKRNLQFYQSQTYKKFPPTNFHLTFDSSLIPSNDGVLWNKSS